MANKITGTINLQQSSLLNTLNKFRPAEFFRKIYFSFPSQILSLFDDS